MIRVLFLQQPNGKLLGFQMTGHSGLAEEGSDTLCVTVPSMACLTASTITDMVQIRVDLSVSEDDISPRVPEKTVLLYRTLLQRFRLHLMGLQE